LKICFVTSTIDDYGVEGKKKTHTHTHTFNKFGYYPTIEGTHIDATKWVFALPFGRHLPPPTKMFDNNT
jgi:hypothetical protein